MDKPRWSEVARNWLAPVAFFGLGVLIRWPLQELLETKLIWLTFYPVVMLSAVLGGLWSGLATAFLAGAFALWGWSFLSPIPFIASVADLVGLGVFLFNGLMMSLLAEAMLRARVQAESAKLEAQQANRAKSVFMAQMSHELRTPFNALLGFSSLLLRAQDTSPRQQEILQIIHKSGTQVLELINGVLEISRIEARREPARLQRVAIRDLVTDVAELLTERVHAKGLELQLEIDPDVPPSVETDATKVRQILFNLVGNAIKFSQTGTIRIGLKVPASDERADPDRWLCLWVADQGCGIAPEDQVRIFAPFEQVASAQSHEGTGLGLAIVDQLTKILGGEIRMESTLGQGSLFSVVFPAPAAEGAVVTSPAPNQPSSAPIQVAPGSEGHRFLVVDDHLDNRLLMKSLHDELGQECHLASNGREAVEQFLKWSPELIWMDIRMAGMDGIEAMKAIRGLPGGQIPIIAVTASVFLDQQQHLSDQGFDAILTKPFPFPRISQLMTQFLGLRFVVSETSAASQARGDLSTITWQESQSVLDALESLDPEVIDQQIQVIQRSNPELGSYLRLSVESLDYAGLRAKVLALRGPKEAP